MQSQSPEGGALTHYHLLTEAHLPLPNWKTSSSPTPAEETISPDPQTAQPTRTQPNSSSPLLPFPCKSKSLCSVLWTCPEFAIAGLPQIAICLLLLTEYNSPPPLSEVQLSTASVTHDQPQYKILNGKIPETNNS